jgi:hypothetical protein
MLQRRISSIRNGKRFVSYAAVRELAAEIGVIAADIRADILPTDPARARTLAEKLFSLDEVIFNRADDSGGSIGCELRDACVLWLDAAAATRANDSGAATDWTVILYDLYQNNDYGVREPLLEEAHLLLREDELRALAARFERDAQDSLERAKSGKQKFHLMFTPSTAMGLVARALRDPALHERSIRIHSAEPNELQMLDIASHYLECGDAPGALRWLQGPWRDSIEYRRLDLLDRAYGLTGEMARQIEIRRDQYRQAPGIHTYRALAELLQGKEKAELRARACVDAASSPHVATAAELLFALDEPALAAKLIVDRVAELDGRSYGLLTSLVETAKANGRLLAATLIWRALLDAILARAYAKAYGHAARYLRALRAVASDIGDYRGHPTHEMYEQSLRMGHGRKTSFWARLVDE